MVTRRDRECKQRPLLGGIAAQGRGSAAATFSNVCSASSCQKECKSATARLKSALTCGLHEVSNDTAPRYAGMGISAHPSVPEAFSERNNRVKTREPGGKVWPH